MGTATGVVVVGCAGGSVAITGAVVAGATVVVVAGSVGAGATTTGRSGSLVDGRDPLAGRAAGSSPYTLGSNSAADRSSFARRDRVLAMEDVVNRDHRAGHECHRGRRQPERHARAADDV